MFDNVSEFAPGNNHLSSKSNNLLYSMCTLLNDLNDSTCGEEAEAWEDSPMITCRGGGIHDIIKLVCVHCARCLSKLG